MPDRMPNRMSEDMSDRMPEDVPVRTCINVMVGITRSKVIFQGIIVMLSGLPLPKCSGPVFLKQKNITPDSNFRANDQGSDATILGGGRCDSRPTTFLGGS